MRSKASMTITRTAALMPRNKALDNGQVSKRGVDHGEGEHDDRPRQDKQ